jgi:putative hydrolase of the HAD superfamily
MKVLKAVLFDADGVLQWPTTMWRTAFGMLPGLADAAPLDEFMQRVLDVEMAFLESEEGFEAALSKVVAELSCQFDSAAVLAVFNGIEVDTEIMGIVQSVRASEMKCYLATNQQRHRARHMSERLGYAGLFDGEFYSCRVGAAKPKRGYFEHVLAALGLPADTVLFIDDRAENVAGAAEVGLRAELYDRKSGADVLCALLAKHGLEVRKPSVVEA